MKARTKQGNHMSETAAIMITGKEIKAGDGANLLQIATDNGSDIPGLCFYDMMTTTCGRRLCMEMIEGCPAMAPSRLVKVEDGF
jgi:formate dehydrogenase alpha subunit